MILIGHPYIPYEAFERIERQEDISQTAPHAVVLFDFNKENISLCHYAKDREVDFALFVESDRDIILASALGAAYIICDRSLVEVAQTFADTYMFDAKILLFASEEKDIAYAAKKSIDGILFKEGVKDARC